MIRRGRFYQNMCNSDPQWIRFLLNHEQALAQVHTVHEFKAGMAINLLAINRSTLQCLRSSHCFYSQIRSMNSFQGGPATVTLKRSFCVFNYSMLKHISPERKRTKEVSQKGPIPGFLVFLKNLEPFTSHLRRCLPILLSHCSRPANAS